MAAKRKEFVCKCGKITTKTVASYNTQIKKLGFALCTECALSRNAKLTSVRMISKYKNSDKNTDVINYPCKRCGCERIVQRRAMKSGYEFCKSCAALLNRESNKETYDKLAASRTQNKKFSIAVSNGLSKLPLEKRIAISHLAHEKRWLGNINERFEHFIEKAVNLHGDKYDYSNSKYVNFTTPIEIICHEHGSFVRTPKEHILSGYGCNRCSELNNISNGHREISEFIQSIGFEVINNDRLTIKPYELDILIPSKKIAIEYNGIYWHSFNSLESPKERLMHVNKLNMTNANDYDLIQIFETEWENNKELVKSMISAKLGISNKLYARNCELRRLDKNEYIDFMNHNHLQGGRYSSYRIGLIYNDTIVSSIGISRHPKYEYELIRFASARNIMVTGGLSKMLNAARIDLGLTKLLTYADRRYSNGKSYLKCGFTHVANTEPNYFYTIGNKNSPLLSRQQFQKHKLNKKLANFDILLSESENMFNHGFRRIWDAGHMKFIKNWYSEVSGPKLTKPIYPR